MKQFAGWDIGPEGTTNKSPRLEASAKLSAFTALWCAFLAAFSSAFGEMGLAGLWLICGALLSHHAVQGQRIMDDLFGRHSWFDRHTYRGP